MELQREKAETLIDFSDITARSFDELLDSLMSEEDMKRFTPDGICRIDPRDGMRIIYSEKRAKRPHDNKPEEDPAPKIEQKECPVCAGNTTRIVDMCDLSEGFTFINKNLFPIFYPGARPGPDVDAYDTQLTDNEIPAWGMHFLQWPSNDHDKDFDNMPVEDSAIVLQRAAFLEDNYLHAEIEGFPSTSMFEDKPHTGYSGIIKNYGHLVGGSLAHGHMQLVFTNLMPRVIELDIQFRKKYSKDFVAYMDEVNPEELMLEETENFKAVIPNFIKRPLQTMIYYKHEDSYLHHVEQSHLTELAQLLKHNLAAVMDIMPRIGREAAYNIIFHSGPGAPFYIEVLPYTQETGGYEHLGIFVCQGSPRTAQEMYKEYWKK